MNCDPLHIDIGTSGEIRQRIPYLWHFAIAKRTWHRGDTTAGFKRKHVLAVTTVNGDLMHTVSTPYGTCRHDDNRSSVWIFRRNEIGGRRQVEFGRWKRNVLVGHIPIGGVGVRVLRRRTSRTGEKRD